MDARGWSWQISKVAKLFLWQALRGVLIRGVLFVGGTRLYDAAAREPELRALEARALKLENCKMLVEPE